MAENVMSTPVLTVTADMTLKEAADFLSENEISGAVVTDSAATPVGVVSLLDIVSAVAGLERPKEELGGFYRMPAPKFDEDEGETGPELEESEDLDPLESTTVSEIMSPNIIGVPLGTPAQEVAKMMWDRHIHRVFVMKAGMPVGVISSFDLLGSLAGERRIRAAG
jgi:predicted transcriptional regulator